MIKKSFLLANLFILASTQASANNTNNYNKVISFGDSLSDGGSFFGMTRYISNNGSEKLYNEKLAEYYTGGQPHLPFTQGGNNYSVGGSSMSSLFSVGQIGWIIDYYLHKNGGKADPNALYTVWGGGIDVSASYIAFYAMDYFTGQNYRENPGLVYATSHYAEQVRKLSNAGAKNIVTFSLPRIGATPSQASIMVSILQLLTLQGGLQNKLDAKIRAQSASSTEEWVSIYSKAINDVVFGDDNMTTFPVIDFIFRELVTVLNETTDAWNARLKNEMSQFEGNVIHIDIAKIFDEIYHDPKQYGFDDILLPKCTIDISAINCDPTDPSYRHDVVTVYSDWFHPSPEAHNMIFEYIVSVLEAANSVAKLTHSLKELQVNRKSNLDSFLHSQRHLFTEGKERDTWSIFGGYSGSDSRMSDSLSAGKNRSNALSIGTAYEAYKNILIGATLTVNSSQYVKDPALQVDHTGYVGTLFAQIGEQRKAWGTIDAHYGDINFKDVGRIIRLGAANRIENGQTKGNIHGVRANSGYGFELHKNILFTPSLGFSWEEYRIKGYSEYKDSSTSMYFSEQKGRNKIGRVGLELSTHSLLINPYLSIDYLRDFSANKKYTFDVGLLSTDTYFVRDVNIIGAKEWYDIKIGANAKFYDNVTMYGMVGVMPKADTKTYYSAGLSFSF